MLRKTIAALAIAFALGGSALPTSALALGSAFEGDSIAGGAYAYHGDRVGNSHRRPLPGQGQRNQWDPWGHWGSYYGPMVHGP
jgi:hypothetical protein